MMMMMMMPGEEKTTRNEEKWSWTQDGCLYTAEILKVYR